MKHTPSTHPLKTIIEQTDKNATSWFGHITGEVKHRITGQTFICPTPGNVSSISVYTSYVVNKGTV
ncbi:MAG: hypothetical protein IPL84_00600 [Chitinophagaceae bacterium]|nr:hypothetical protein [Chitinophagaceae bacterium]